MDFNKIYEAVDERDQEKLDKINKDTWGDGSCPICGEPMFNGKCEYCEEDPYINDEDDDDFDDIENNEYEEDDENEEVDSEDTWEDKLYDDIEDKEFEDKEFEDDLTFSDDDDDDDFDEEY